MQSTEIDSIPNEAHLMNIYPRELCGFSFFPEIDPSDLLLLVLKR
jgi:hypothetical protein